MIGQSSDARRPALLLVPIILLFLVEVLPYLRTRWVEDENFYAIGGYTLITEGRLRQPIFPPTDIESVVDMRPPGIAILDGAAFKLFGLGILQARFPAVMASLGTVVVVFLLGAELGGLWLGVAAALAAAADNFLFLAARTVRPEAFVTFLGAAAIWLMLVACRKSSLGLALASGVFVGLATWFHPTSLAIGAGLAALRFRDCGWRIVSDKIAWMLAIGFMATALPLLVRAQMSPENRQSSAALYGRGRNSTVGEMLTREQSRYSDFIGISSQRFGLPVRIPVRLHIALILAAAFVVLFRKNRRMFWVLFLLLIPNPLWWAFLVNNTSRYLAMVSPILALAVAAAALALWDGGRKKLTAVVFAIFVCTQVGANLIYLYRTRTADYLGVARSLQAVIPKDKSVYCANTFWMALYDHRMWAYHRTPFDYAVENLKPDYLILNDRVMVAGFGYGVDDVADLRKAANEFAHKHATLVTQVNSAFYGDLDIYKVNW